MKYHGHLRAAVLLGAVFLICLHSVSAQEGGPGRSGGAPGLFAPAEETTRSRMIQVGGRLKPAASIEHSSPAEGVVREVFVSPGDRVAEGDLLFSVDRSEAGQTFRLATVRSRITGTISVVQAEPEQEVSDGESLVTVIGRSGFILEAEISDKDAYKVALGQKVQANTSAGVLFSGTLTNRSPEPDYSTGLYNLRFDFPPSPDLHPGTFVLVDLPADTLTGFFVPADAVDRRYGRNFLWLADRQKQVYIRREVVLGGSMGSDILVSSGLSVGEEFLLKPTGRERADAPLPGQGGQPKRRP